MREVLHSQECGDHMLMFHAATGGHADCTCGVEPEGTWSVACALCEGYGETGNPGNADPAVKVTDWLPPVICPRCGGTGKDPNP